MSETKKISLGGAEVTVTEVEIAARRREEVNEYELKDGSVIRVANQALVVYRVEGSRDLEGNPVYLVKVGTSVSVVRSRKPASSN